MKCFVVLFLIGAIPICHSRAVDSNISVYAQQAAGPEDITINVYRQIANNIAEKITDPIWKFLGFDGLASRRSRKCPRKNGMDDDKPPIGEPKTNKTTEITTVQGHTFTTNGLSPNETEMNTDDFPLDWSTSSGNITDNSIKEPAWEIIGNSSAKALNTTIFNLKVKKGNKLEGARDVEELSPEKAKETKKKPEKIISTSTTEPDPFNDSINEISDDEFLLNFDPYEEKPKENGIVYFLEVVGSIFQLAWGAISSVFKPKSD